MTKPLIIAFISILYLTQAFAGDSKAYQLLAKRFNTELAGRFPFGDFSSPDADSDFIKSFLVDYKLVSPNLGGKLNAAQKKFIAKMVLVRFLLNSLRSNSFSFQGRVYEGPAIILLDPYQKI
jgi:hypothetical protein